MYFYVKMDSDHDLEYVLDEIPDLLFFSGYSLLLQIWWVSSWLGAAAPRPRALLWLLLCSAPLLQRPSSAAPLWSAAADCGPAVGAAAL